MPVSETRLTRGACPRLTSGAVLSFDQEQWETEKTKEGSQLSISLHATLIQFFQQIGYTRNIIAILQITNTKIMLFWQRTNHDDIWVNFSKTQGKKWTKWHVKFFTLQSISTWTIHISNLQCCIQQKLKQFIIYFSFTRLHDIIMWNNYYCKHIATNMPFSLSADT